MPSPDRPAARPAEPALWLLRVPEVPAAGLAVELLDAEETARAAAFLHDADRVRYLAAHIALRRLLAEATGKPARDLVLIREPCPCCGALHGRPALADPPRPLHFSLSHGGDLVLVGMAAVPIGVDVEALTNRSAGARLESVLHPAEQRELAAVPAERRTAAFVRLWTRKEAYLKGLGTGLGRDTAADYLGTAGLAPSPPLWTVTDVDVGPAHAAAVALRAPAAQSPGPDPRGTPELGRLPGSYVARTSG